MAHPVTWFHISVGGDDLAATEEFYKSVFGWGMTLGGDGATRMIAPEEGGIGGGLGPSPDGKANIAIYASVDDLAAHLKKVQDAGGTIAMPPMELGGGMGWIGGVTDPAGNWFGLWQPGAVSGSAEEGAGEKGPAKKAPRRKQRPKEAAPKAVSKKARREEGRCEERRPPRRQRSRRPRRKPRRRPPRRRARSDSRRRSCLTPRSVTPSKTESRRSRCTGLNA